MSAIIEYYTNPFKYWILTTNPSNVLIMSFGCECTMCTGFGLKDISWNPCGSTSTSTDDFDCIFKQFCYNSISIKSVFKYIHVIFCLVMSTFWRFALALTHDVNTVVTYWDQKAAHTCSHILLKSQRHCQIESSIELLQKICKVYERFFWRCTFPGRDVFPLHLNPCTDKTRFGCRSPDMIKKAEWQELTVSTFRCFIILFSELF